MHKACQAFQLILFRLSRFIWYWKLFKKISTVPLKFLRFLSKIEVSNEISMKRARRCDGAIQDELSDTTKRLLCRLIGFTAYDINEDSNVRGRVHRCTPISYLRWVTLTRCTKRFDACRQLIAVMHRSNYNGTTGIRMVNNRKGIYIYIYIGSRDPSRSRVAVVNFVPRILLSSARPTFKSQRRRIWLWKMYIPYIR